VTKKQRDLIIAAVSATAILSVGVFYGFDIFGLQSPYPGVGKPGSEHVHATFKVYVEGESLYFSSQNNPEYVKASEYIFLEDAPQIIHRFAKGATLGMFFEAMGLEFNSSCIKLDKPIMGFNSTVTRFSGKTEFCNEGDKVLKFYVNGKLNEEYEKYVINDGDKILPSYGIHTEKSIKSQLNTLG